MRTANTNSKQLNATVKGFFDTLKKKSLLICFSFTLNLIGFSASWTAGISTMRCVLDYCIPFLVSMLLVGTIPKKIDSYLNGDFSEYYLSPIALSIKLLVVILVLIAAVKHSGNSPAQLYAYLLLPLSIPLIYFPKIQGLHSLIIIVAVLLCEMLLIAENTLFGFISLCAVVAGVFVLSIGKVLSNQRPATVKAKAIGNEIIVLIVSLIVVNALFPEIISVRNIELSYHPYLTSITNNDRAIGYAIAFTVLYLVFFFLIISDVLSCETSPSIILIKATMMLPLLLPAFLSVGLNIAIEIPFLTPSFSNNILASAYLSFLISSDISEYNYIYDLYYEIDEDEVWGDDDELPSCLQNSDDEKE